MRYAKYLIFLSPFFWLGYGVELAIDMLDAGVAFYNRQQYIHDDGSVDGDN